MRRGFSRGGMSRGYNFKILNGTFKQKNRRRKEENGGGTEEKENIRKKRFYIS